MSRGCQAVANIPRGCEEPADISRGCQVVAMPSGSEAVAPDHATLWSGAHGKGTERSDSESYMYDSAGRYMYRPGPRRMRRGLTHLD